MPAAMRIVLRRRDGRLMSGFTPAFDPADGGVMVAVAPASPLGTMVQLDIVQVLVLEPTDGRPLPPPKVHRTKPSPGVRVSFADGTGLVGGEGAISPGVGVWMRPPRDKFGRAFIPEGAASTVELLDQSPGDVDPEMWAFLNDSTPTDEVEIPERYDSELSTREIDVVTTPTSVTKPGLE